MDAVIDFVVNNWGLIATVLFLISEILAQIPSVKSNSIFQLIVGLLKPKTPPTV